jgi:hypothetical protein
LEVQLKHCPLVLVIATVIAAPYVSDAGAQGYLAPTFETLKPTIPELVGVWERPRPDYDAVGLKVGAFTWYPSVEVSEMHDDNVYATKTGTVSDWVSTVRPGVRVKSNWSVHAFEAYGMVEGVWYNELSSDDRTNAGAGFNGVIDITRDSRIRYFGSWLRGHEDRSVSSLFASSAVVGLLNKPVEYDALTGGVALDQRFNHVTVSVSGNYGRNTYQDSFAGSTRVDQSYRDQDTFGGRLRIGHDIGPSGQAYVEGGYERRDYKFGSFNSDSYRLVGGLAGNVTALIHGDVYVGYQQRDYDQRVISTVNDWTYGGALSWYASPLVTVALFGERSINETTFGAVGSFIQSRVGTRVDFEALRNVILTGRLGYEWDDYNQTNRADKVLSVGFTSTFLINRNLSLALDYQFTDRTSSFNSLDYSRNLAGGRIRVQY